MKDVRTYGRRWTLAASALVLMVYVEVLAVMPKHVFWSPDEGGKFLELSSIHWHGGLIYRVPYAGQRIDPNRRFYPHAPKTGATLPYPVTDADGTIRFHWPIWFPLLSRFMLRTFGMTGLYVLPLLSGWLIAVVSGWITHSVRPRLAPLAILLVGFATPICFYSQLFWEHTLASLLGLVALAIVLASRPGSLGALAAMLLPLIAAMMLRIEMAAFAVAGLLLWGILAMVTRARAPLHPDTTTAATQLVRRPRRFRKGGAYLLAACLMAGMLYLFQKHAPGRQHHFITNLPERLELIAHELPYMPASLVSVFVHAGHSEAPVLNPAWAALTCIAVALCFVAPFVTSVRAEAILIVPALLVLLGFSTWVALLGQAYRSLHGIFPIAPFMVVWLYALADAWRRRDPTLLTLAGFSALYLITGCAAIALFYVNKAGGLSTGLEWGQRYLLTLYPLLTILSLVALSAYRVSKRPGPLKATFTVLVSAMMLVGVGQEVRGLAMLLHSRATYTVWDQALRRNGPIVTDVWWLPTALAPLFLAKEMYFVGSPTELADWVPLAAAHATSGFTFASLVPVKDRQLGNPTVRRVPQGSLSLFGLQIEQFALVADGTPAPTP